MTSEFVLIVYFDQQKTVIFNMTVFLQLIIGFLQNIPAAHVSGNFADFLIRHRDLYIDLQRNLRWNNIAKDIEREVRW